MAMNRVCHLGATVVAAIGCSGLGSVPGLGAKALAMTGDRAVAAEMPVKTVDFGKHFRASGVEGSILIVDLKGDRVYQHNPQGNPQRNAQPMLPASTFKILNALIALETGVVRDELAVLTWDGIERPGPGWNRDLNLKEAMRLSAVWFYQVLARRIGHGRMQEWVSRVGYGNQKIGGPADIDRFWLEGALRITPEQQVQFLRRLYQNELPFSARTMAIVKEMMVLEQTPNYTLRGKTGWAGFGAQGPQVGWLVGYLEQGGSVYIFATNVDIQKPEDARARMALTRRCLGELGLMN
jgi:beta-lactamase class D